MSTAPLELDGSFGEGGGQILRTSLALSLLTGRPLRLHNIRAGRPKPGLQPQHLQSVRAAAAIGQAQLAGASLHSTELTFEPGPILPGSYRFDIGTAGATIDRYDATTVRYLGTLNLGADMTGMEIVPAALAPPR